jgi:death-on-curing protein
VSDLLFLSKEAVLAYHEQQIQLYGGDPGVSDHGLLESALAQPQNTWLYTSEADVFDVAAAYAFHIAKNHAFTDGNKRTALMAALGFLKQNHIEAQFDHDELFVQMIALTEGRIFKPELANVLYLGGTNNFFDVGLQTIDEEMRAISVGRPKAEPAMAKALILDYVASKIQAVLVTKCEELNINQHRFDDTIPQVEKALLAMIPEDLRAQFGL